MSVIKNHHLVGSSFELLSEHQLLHLFLGPWGVPLIGSLLTLIKFNRENAILKIQEYKETYGKIFSINVGTYRCIKKHFLST